MKNILLTGASGFIGKHLFEKIKLNYQVHLLLRSPSKIHEYTHVYENIDASSDFSTALGSIDCVIHLAARAHILKEQAALPLEQFRAVNRDLTLNLAKQAAKNGVKRFIYISSIGVNGVCNESPFKFSDDPMPVDDYALSKLEAEQDLRCLAKETGMEVVIIRPPLVYGKGAPGNFERLVKLTSRNLPLPLGAINNKRSFVSVDNLTDLIVTCIDHPQAKNETFLVSDDEDVSTSQLLVKMLSAQGKPNMLIPIPVNILKLLGSIFKRKAVIERFTNSLTVDIEHTKKTLGWLPPISLDEGIARCFNENYKDK
ncbi:UDP-glucose 4-epimerase family protein [Pseudoalteromonas sp. SS15]|uniref:UDP-glucose 4-epimerase family protein n=1 Tax=Pseudoalteromonas sp. SS15 TaxID=3139393 RepID=UPI003BAA5084